MNIGPRTNTKAEHFVLWGLYHFAKIKDILKVYDDSKVIVEWLRGSHILFSFFIGSKGPRI